MQHAPRRPLKRIERHPPGRTLLTVASFILVTLAPGPDATAQSSTGTVRVVVESEGERLAGVEVRSETATSLTDARGEAVLRLLAGRRTIHAERIGYAANSVEVDVRAGADTTVVITLVAEAVEAEEIVVLSTRTGRRIEDQPVRVEVLTREEVEEKMLMTPGDISMMLNETSGLRVQTTSPSLGGANVRIQGLRGRYTQMLSDGLPLYGGQSGALSMLQIPPMDLAQVEVIKGVASALYGATALGGVVNLISRRPGDEDELLLNQTTRGGTDAILWSSGALSERWGYTFLGSVHRQSTHDVDDDGWADLPGHRRAVIRPRAFWNDGRGRSLFVTVGATAEDREGGTLGDALAPDGSRYTESLDTRRGDAGLVGRFLLGGDHLLSVRASAMRQEHDHGFGSTRERDAHTTAFGELALTGATGVHTWVVGAAIQRENYDAHDIQGFDFTHITPSIFGQNEVDISPWLTAALSGRLDAHGEYGTFFNPRLSILVRPGGTWNIRASVGTGYFAPTPFTEETEVVGLSVLDPLQGLEAERARSASIDVARTIGPFELNATVFGSEVSDPLMARSAGEDRLELFNAAAPVRTRGIDLLARFHEEPFHITATYALTHSTEPDAETEIRRNVPLTPRHAAGIVGMWEAEGQGRVGIELYYNGRQDLEDNPYRATSRPYVILGFLIERRFGGARLFLNAENLLDARQTRFDPLLLPARSAEGRWTTDAWAPLEGRTFNAGVRLDL